MSDLQPRPEDTRWAQSAEEGEPDCLCSRCGELIPESDVAIRMWPADGRYELRYHPSCLGIQVLNGDDYFDDIDPYEHDP